MPALHREAPSQTVVAGELVRVATQGLVGCWEVEGLSAQYSGRKDNGLQPKERLMFTISYPLQQVFCLCKQVAICTVFAHTTLAEDIQEAN